MTAEAQHAEMTYCLDKAVSATCHEDEVVKNQATVSDIQRLTVQIEEIDARFGTLSSARAIASLRNTHRAKKHKMTEQIVQEQQFFFDDQSS